MSTLQIALIAGALMAIGPVLLIARYAPRHPALGAYLDAATGPTRYEAATAETVSDGLEDRVGYWLQRRIGSAVKTPTMELELLRIPTHRFLAQKVSFAIIGLVFPTIVTALLYVMGLRPPIAVPVIVSLALAAALSFVPEYNVRRAASRARAEFAYMLGAYMDLVALERKAGSSPRQALEQAAEVADSWVFRRLAEELAHSRLAGISPWDKLRELGERYSVTELTELAHIMKIAGAESAGVYETLKQRSRALRKAHMAKELTAANETSTRRHVPIAVLGFVFLAMMVTPALLSVLTLAG